MSINKTSHIFTIETDTKRIFGLDLLRAVAILFVVVEHGGFLLPPTLRKLNNLLVFDGVSIFFVLSGFLIGGLLIKSIQDNGIRVSALFNFWIRRWFRTLPNYLLVLIILCGINCFVTTGFSIADVSRYFIFSQNLFGPHPAWFFPEAWSLSIEEWFYLLIPPIIFMLIGLLKVSPKIAILSTAILIILTITLFRYMRFEHTMITNANDWDLLFRKQVSTRLDSLMYGVIGAYLNGYYYTNVWLRFKRPLLILGILLMLAARLLLHVYGYTGGYACIFSFSVMSLATLLMLPFLSSLKSAKGRGCKVITRLSLISYSMYLLNLSVIQHGIIGRIEWRAFLNSAAMITLYQYVLYWLLTITLSILLYKYFEVPMTKLRDHYKIKQ